MFAKLALLLGIAAFILISFYTQINVAEAQTEDCDSQTGTPDNPKQDNPETSITPGKPKDDSITQDYG